MGHSVGALLLPAPAPASATAALTDPAIDIIAAYLSGVMTLWLQTAWNARAPGEPVVRTVYKHDPQEIDFSTKKLPILCLWRERDAEVVQLADAYDESESTLNVLWILPPAPQEKDSSRFSFFNGFASAIKLAVKLGRHPAYVHASEVGQAGPTAYGSDVLKLAAIDRWKRGTIIRSDVTVQGMDAPFMGYLATILLTETTHRDGTVDGVFPTIIRGDITDGLEPELIRQPFKSPTEPD